MLSERFHTIDYSQAKTDVEPFIRDPSVLNVWSADFFQQITEKLAVCWYEEELQIKKAGIPNILQGKVFHETAEVQAYKFSDNAVNYG